LRIIEVCEPNTGVSRKDLISTISRQYYAFMSFIIELWMPILLSAVLVFVASSIIHMVLQGWHASDCHGLKGEEGVMRALREAGNGPGEYMMPYPSSMEEMKSDVYCAKMKEGPVGRVILMPGNSFHMGSSLLQWFIFCVVVGIFCAYIMQFALAEGTDYMAVFRLTSVVAFCSYAFSHAHNLIWAGTPLKVALKFGLDGLVYALITGGTFGWLMNC
jgi:hypothetical protein